MAGIDSQWNQKIDKISYGVAGFLVLIVLCVPFLVGGAADTGPIDQAIGELRTAIERQQGSLDPPKPVDLEAILKSQWTAGPALALDPTWRTDRDPLLVKVVKEGQKENAVHDAGQILEIACERDAAKKAVVLVVKGAASDKNTHVVLKKMELLRSEEKGQFAVHATLEPGPTFEHRDEKVEVGKSYSYKLRTVAARDPKAPQQIVFDAAREGTKESEPLDPTPPVPYDFSLVVQRIDLDADASAKLLGKLIYWDYKANKAMPPDFATSGGTFKDMKEKETFADGRFVLLRMNPEAAEVIVQDKQTNARHTINVSQKTPMPVAAWNPVTREGPKPPEGGDEEEPPKPDVKTKADAKAGKKAEPKKAPPKKDEKKPGRKKFGE